MNGKAMVGLYFLFDNTGEHYRTGEILELVSGGGDSHAYYLLKFDCHNESPIMPLEVASIDDFTLVNEEINIKQFNFFRTREELNTWVKWIESPIEEGKGEKIVSLVKTSKGRLKKKEFDEDEDDTL